MGATDATDAVLHALESLYPGDPVLVAAANVAVEVAAVYVAGHVVARLAARRGAAVRHAVWLAALGCVVAGAVITAAVPRGGLSVIRVSAKPDDAPWRHVTAPTPPRADSLPTVPDVARPPTATDGEAEAVASDVTVVPRPAAAAESQAAASPRPSAPPVSPFRAVAGGVALVWTGGVLLGLLRLARAWRWTVRVRRGARSPAGSIPDAVLDRVRHALRIERLPRICVSDAVDSPVSLGLRRPVVLLPAGLAESVDATQLRDVLVHECAHVLRRDHAVGLVQRLAGIVLWPHPCIHLLNRAMNRTREEVCDNYVLSGPDVTAAAGRYARALLALAEWCAGRPHESDDVPITRPPRRPAAAPGLPVIGILGPGWRLEARVAGLIDARRSVMTRLTHRTRLLLAAGFLVALATAGGARLVSAEPPAKPADKPRANPAAPDVPGGASARDEASDGTAGGSAPATGEAGKPATAPAAKADAAMAALLDRKVPELRFDGVAFADVIDFLRDVTGGNVFVDWAALEAAGIDRNAPVTYRAKDVRTAGVLKDVTTLVGHVKNPVTYGAAGGVIFISSPQRVERFVAGSNAVADKGLDPASRTLLDRTLPEVRFDGVGLADVIDFLRDVSGATINVHWAELEAAGIDRNAPVTVRLKNVKFGQALHVMLSGVAGETPLEFTAEEGRLLIRNAPAAPKPETKPAGPRR